MSRIASRFKTKLLIPYVMAGYPDLLTSGKIIKALVAIGCPLIEIGIPYSDPLADGTTIQKASEVALNWGINTDNVFDLLKKLRLKIDFSPVLMVYYNLVYRYGLEKFAEKAEDSGVEGVIIPDLTVEESTLWLQAAKNRLDTIFLVAPTSSLERIKKISAVSRGFIYCVSLTGVTGARNILPADLVDFINKVKGIVSLPIAVGFGISIPQQGKEVASVADGIIIGSALIDLIEKGPANEVSERVAAFGQKILEAIKEVG